MAEIWYMKIEKIVKLVNILIQKTKLNSQFYEIDKLVYFIRLSSEYTEITSFVSN